MIKQLSVTLAMAMTLFAAHARETITIVWGFNIGSKQVNLINGAK